MVPSRVVTRLLRLALGRMTGTAIHQEAHTSPATLGSSMRGRWRSIARTALWQVSVAALLALLSTAISGGLGSASAPQLLLRFLLWSWWVVLSPVVHRLSRRFPLTRAPQPAHLALHVGFATLFGAAYVLFLAFLATVRVGHGLDLVMLAEKARLLQGRWSLGLALYVAILAGCLILDRYRHLRAREFRAAQLEGLLAQARLQALEAQLRPHFLFNTLRAVSSLMENDVKGARRMIARLSDLLRASFTQRATQEVALRHELDTFDLYLNIERVRFRDRLRVFRDVEPDTLEARVPALFLQPLVENAICHGVAASSRAGRATLVARRRGGTLYLAVLDDGPGLRPGAGEERKGMGLSITRARLAELYGSEFKLELHDREGGGCEAVVEIPFQEATT